MLRLSSAPGVQFSYDTLLMMRKKKLPVLNIINTTSIDSVTQVGTSTVLLL